MKKLWDTRPGRDYEPKMNRLIGKTAEREEIGEEIVKETIAISQVNVQCAMIDVPDELPTLTTKIVKKVKNNQNFMPKPSNSYGLTTFMSKNRYRDSSD